MEDPMPDQAYRHPQLPGSNAKAWQPLAGRASSDDSTNNPRAIVGTPLAIDHNAVRHSPQFEADAHMPAFDRI
jgi:hypothetical protein